MKYDFSTVEKKWQKYWEEHETFKTDVWDFSKPKFYALDMFPYPSGVGLHAGHPEGYTGGSFYWYTSPGNVDGGDVRSHDLFVQRAKEHPNDVWEWVEARTRYGLRPPYLGEDQLVLHSDGTRYTLDQLGLDAEHQIHQTLHIGFHTYDTTGWSNPYWFD